MASPSVTALHLAHAPPAPPPLPLGDQIARLVAGGPQAWMPLFTSLTRLAVNLALGAVILVVTLWLAGFASRLARRAAGRFRRHATDTVLQDFMASLIRWVVVVVGGIAVLEQIGVRTTSVLAVLGAASLAIGLALQGGLSNVAAGVMLLLLRPYRIGDRVEVAGTVGKVQGMDLFVTCLHDLDNSVVFIPNSKALGDKIVNYTMPSSRRIAVDFGVPDDEHLDRAIEIILDAAEADARVAHEPGPWAKVTGVADGVATVTLRAWVPPAGYNDTRFDLMRAVKQRLQAAGLAAPSSAK